MLLTKGNNLAINMLYVTQANSRMWQMKGVTKNREQLIGELDALRQHVVGLDRLEAERKKMEGELKNTVIILRSW